ncbi:MAG: exopolysaccharide transport family protein [Methylovirgula sp.]|uniref:GumC family protein n=1 Tax=Methylovirgula sp. TaxID=1978224 RepID=UPI00307650AA
MKEAYEPDMMVDDASHDMSLGALGAALYARKYWVLIPTLLAFLLALAYVTVAKPRYTADAQILLENQESYLTRAQRTEGMETAPAIDETWIGSQVSLITSRDVAQEVIEKLDLVGNPELDPVSKGLGVIQRTLVLFGLARDPTRVSAEDRTIATFSDRLTAYSPIKTQVLMVDFWAHDPVFAAKVANEVAAVYLERQTDAKRDLAKDVGDALNSQISVLNEKLARASDEVERYRAASGLLAGANNMTITAQQLADLNTDLTRARTDEANSQAKAALIRQLLRKGRVSEIPDVANNDLIRRISEQRVTANAQLALEAGTLGPRHPRILELKAEIEDLNAQLRLAGDNIAISLENDSKIAASRVANIQTALDQQKQAVETANTNSVQLRALEQVEAGYREQLQSATTKYQEAVSRQSGATPADARIIAAATAPDQPSFPKKPQVLGLATLAAFVLSLGIVVGRELLADRPLSDAAGDDVPEMPVRVAEQKRRPAVSTIERLKRFASARVAEPDDEELVAATTPDDPNDKVAAKSTTPQGVNIVATRLNKSKEATDALISFARTLARDGRPVIVDLDSRDDELTKLIGPEAQDGKMMGLTDLLDGEASFADVIHRDAASRLHFVPFGSKDTFNPDDLDIVLDALSRTYDFVVLAAPPFPGNPMTKALAPYADFVVLATAGERDDTATQTARAELGAAGAPEVLLVGGVKQAA